MRLPNRPLAFAVALLLLLTWACTNPVGVTVSDSFARASPSAGGNSGAFMTITNNSRTTDRLVSAESASARAVELHETVNEGGVMQMRPQPGGFEIAAEGKLDLAPGGKHIMLIGLLAPLEAGQTIEITLTFQKAGVVRVEVPVRAP